MTSVTSPETASRKLKNSPLRRMSEIFLVGGTVMAIAAAFGPIWIVRLGLAAIAAAAVACAFRLARAPHQQTRSRAGHARGHTEAWCGADRGADSERRGRPDLDAAGLRCRQDNREAASHDCQAASADLQLEGRSGLPAGEVQHREKVISALRETVREREAELIALRDEPDAEIHHMPRRVLAEHDSVWRELDATDALRPTMADFTVIEMVMPNYEADRQFA